MQNYKIALIIGDSILKESIGAEEIFSICKEFSYDRIYHNFTGGAELKDVCGTIFAKGMSQINRDFKENYFVDVFVCAGANEQTTVDKFG